MDRFTVSLDENLLAQFDAHIKRKGYGSRSEAVRDILRDRLEAERLASGEAGHCVACLSYVYNHNERELSHRLTHAQHDHHDLTLSTLHVHLDHENCMEVAILQGETAAVTRFADTLVSETGVRHGHANIVPVDMVAHAHGHGDHHHHHDAPPHVHNRPKT